LTVVNDAPSGVVGSNSETSTQS